MLISHAFRLNVFFGMTKFYFDSSMRVCNYAKILINNVLILVINNQLQLQGKEETRRSMRHYKISRARRDLKEGVVSLPNVSI